MNDMSWAKQVMSSGVLQCLEMTEGRPPNGSLVGVYIPTSQWQETPNIPARAAARNGRSVWTELSFLGHLFLVSDHSIIAWGIRTTNLICWIINFQGTCDPCCYSVLLLRPQTIWMEVPSLARSWKLQEHVWEWGGALVPGTSLRLEAILLAGCLRAQGPKSKSLSWLCLWSMWVAALLVTMRFLQTQIGNCRIWSDWK